ncbi:hypothetical protein JCM16303_005617 [Sporobolomyces ruberrimus]
MTSAHAQIDLKTSDDPPVVLSVSRSALIVQSRVFADMLSVGRDSDSDDNTIPITETEAELGHFLLVVEGKYEEAKEALKVAKNAEWEKLAELGDKYDCLIVRQIVADKAWRLTTGTGDARLAFTLATLIGNPSLIECTGKRVVCSRDLQTPALHAAQQWKDRLEMWRVAKLARSQATIDAELQYLDVDVECGDQECKDKLAAAHDRFKAAVWSNFTLFSDTPLKLGAILMSTAPDFDICEFEQFDGNIRSVASSLVQELSKWPDFPVDGMTAEWMKENMRFR